MSIKIIKKISPSDILGRIFLIAYTLIVVYPVLWTMSCSLKTNADLFDNIFGFPTKFHFENYVNAWVKSGVSQYFFNSVGITIGSLFFMLMFATMASYALARYKFKLNKMITIIYISGIMIPGIAGIIPLFLELKSFGMLDNRAVLVLINTVNMMPFSVFMLIAFFKTIPSEIEEAGIIDGCSKFRLFGNVMLPLAVPGIIPLIIIQFMNCWSEIYFSLILISSDFKKPLQVGLYNLQKVQYQRADWVVLFAAIVIVMIPTMVMYILFQRRIIEGVSIGAVKG
jgi:N-acetylglucosamine transport system permease protein